MTARGVLTSRVWAMLGEIFQGPARMTERQIARAARKIERASLVQLHAWARGLAS